MDIISNQVIKKEPTVKEPSVFSGIKERMIDHIYHLEQCHNAKSKLFH